MTIIQLASTDDKDFPLGNSNSMFLQSNVIHFNKTNNNLFPSKSGIELPSNSIPYNQNYDRKTNRINTGNTLSTNISKSFQDSNSFTNGPNLISKIYKQISTSSAFQQKYSVKQKKIDAYLYFLHSYLMIVKLTVVDLIDFTTITCVSEIGTERKIQATDIRSQEYHKNVYNSGNRKKNRIRQSNLKNIFESDIQNIDRGLYTSQKNVFRKEIPKTNQKPVLNSVVKKSDQSSQANIIELPMTNQKPVLNTVVKKSDQSSQANIIELPMTNQKPVLNSKVLKTDQSSEVSQKNLKKGVTRKANRISQANQKNYYKNDILKRGKTSQVTPMNIYKNEILKTTSSYLEDPKNVYKNKLQKTNSSYLEDPRNFYKNEILKTNSSYLEDPKNVYKNKLQKTNSSYLEDPKNVYKNELRKTNSSYLEDPKNVYKNKLRKTNSSYLEDPKNVYKNEIRKTNSSYLELPKTNKKHILNSGIQKTVPSYQAIQILTFRRSTKNTLVDKKEYINPNCYFLTHIAFLQDAVIQNSMNCNFLYYQCFLAAFNDLFAASVVKLNIYESKTILTKLYQIEPKSAKNNFQIFPSMKTFIFGRKSFRTLGFLNKLLTNKYFFFHSQSKRLSSIHSRDDEKRRNSSIAINGLYKVVSSKNSQRF